MSKYHENCNHKNEYEPCEFMKNSECNKYKEKSDELYLKAGMIHDESKRLLCEAKELDNQAKELERRAKQVCAQANIAWDNARKLDAEGDSLLDLASFYSQKAAECAKNESNAYVFRPTCNMNSCYNQSCNSCKSSRPKHYC